MAAPPRPPIYGMKHDRLTRDCFLYLHPAPPVDRFAQCGSCKMWLVNDLCAIHGSDVKVTAGMSCGLYINGDPITDPQPGDTKKIVTPIESGLVSREVRCENCKWGGPDVYVCGLFETLNAELPDEFKLDINIEPKGCCNAQQPIGR